ncbi:GNAT family N-acetyltransferase [Actinospica robiniae]|uniref:Acetyltransferase, ribosomal protein N-acetylase n=1 Tax=Actinospica robiniae DSM 44927 TaxID=479430 RepID=W9DW68_9ACTN|nr:GNAT family protein [Actinospica robiniae]ETA71059.1 acetyltransferase, ribosomal protein N-acetylase [Actinospica robiniae DSM 44927]
MTETEISFADKATLVGNLVLLRPVGVADVPGLLELLRDPESARMTGTHMDSEPDARAAEDWYATRAEHDDRLDLAIVERAGGAYVGEVVLNELDPVNRSCGFRICLVGPRAFGRGFGSEATRLALTHAFETVGVNRVELEVYAFNPRARHVYEQAGFVHEGTKRQALRWDGEWVDAHLMALLASDWKTL